MLAWRHLYTRAADGVLGAPGFQTVACAGEIDDRRRRALEQLVTRALDAAAGGHRTLLLQPSPSDAGRCVLTRIEPLGASFDGRPGNSWSESLVVPQSWLARAGWDAAAAFDALDWWGPEGAERHLESARSGRPAALAEESLPPLGPGPEERLARLAELVPERELRQALLECFAWQAAQDREPPRPIHVVPPDGDAVAELEELLLLLPMAFAPDRRTRSADGETRCLRLATFAAPGALVAPDLVGVPESQLDTVRAGRGMVVDLGGSVPPPASGDAASRDLARQVDARITGGAPRRRDAGRSRGEARPARAAAAAESLASPLEAAALAAGTELAGGAAAALAARTALWRQREETEGGLGELLDLLRRDREQLLRRVETQVREQTRRFETEVDDLRRRLQEAERDGRRRLQGTANELRGELEAAIDGGRAEIDRAAQGREGTAQRLREDALARLEHEHEAALEEIEGTYDRLARRIQARSRQTLEHLGKVAKEAGVEPPPLPPLPEVDDEPPVRRRRTGLGAAHARRRLDELLRDRRAWLAAGVVLLLVAALAAWRFVPWGRDAGTEPPATSTGTAPSTQSADALAAQATVLLRRGEVARALLRDARGHPALLPAAARAALLLRLGPERGLDAETSCVLLQTVVRRWQRQTGGAAIGVDGNCGTSTRNGAAAMADAAEGCDDGIWSARGACLLNRAVGAERAADCAATWPFTRACPWTAEEADALLALLRRAAGETDALQLARWDLAAGEAAAGTVPDEIGAQEARRLVGLAVRTAAAEAGGADVEGDGDGTSVEELRRAVAYLQSLAAGPAAEDAP